MSKLSQDITFVLFTFNEENRIERVILNFIRYGPVLIVDNESTDRTLEIASQYGCDILINKNAGWVEDEATTSKVKAAVKTPWIYWGFSDEMVEAKTMGAIVSAVSSDRYDIINIARKNYYYGRFCENLFSDRMNRIFKKDSIDFNGNKIHQFGRVMPSARICSLPLEHFVHHFISNTAKSYLHAMDRYTDTESTENRPVPRISGLCLSSAKMLINSLLFRRGYRAGMPGYFLLAQMLYYRWLSAMKVYEEDQQLDRDRIESKNNIHRDRILQSLR
ncbi:glycosyltransferase [Edaphobacter albus]|uniref:glycosyltransferase n=1 Tax=Edaphobacter sp. 4G125 TaxID=2763071 RepID=UPI001646D404|nr:glycosyltransferase [Edaphobacter sp. 4G125]QNI37171.1 hypothetical protein H7846_02240 [Edaphobacter sp. 4G125]